MTALTGAHLPPPPGGGGGSGGAAAGAFDEQLPLYILVDEAAHMVAKTPTTRLRLLHAVGQALWAEHDGAASHLPPGAVASLHVVDMHEPRLGADAPGKLWWYFMDGSRVCREPDVVAAATARAGAKSEAFVASISIAGWYTSKAEWMGQVPAKSPSS